MLLTQAEHGQGRDALLLALAEAWMRLAAASLEPEDRILAVHSRLTDFRLLVEQHFREQKKSDFMPIPWHQTTTLARITMRHLGYGAQGLLHRRLALEASRLLLYTNASAVRVSAELGFEDPSYFSRFYLRMTGHRPRSILEQRRAGMAGPMSGVDVP